MLSHEKRVGKFFQPPGNPWKACGGNAAASMNPMDSSVLDSGLVECLDNWPQMQWNARSVSCMTADIEISWFLDHMRYLFFSVVVKDG